MLLNWLTAMAWIWTVLALVIAAFSMKIGVRKEQELKHSGNGNIVAGWFFLFSAMPSAAWIVARWM